MEKQGQFLCCIGWETSQPSDESVLGKGYTGTYQIILKRMIIYLTILQLTHSPYVQTSFCMGEILLLEIQNAIK